MVFSWSMGLSSWCGLLLPFLLMWTVTLDVGRKTMNSQQAQQQYQPFTVSLASWLSFFVCFLGVSLSESQHSQAKALLQVCYGNRIEWPTVELFLLINIDAFSGRLENLYCAIYCRPVCQLGPSVNWLLEVQATGLHRRGDDFSLTASSSCNLGLFWACLLSLGVLLLLLLPGTALELHCSFLLTVIKLPEEST